MAHSIVRRTILVLAGVLVAGSLLTGCGSVDKPSRQEAGELGMMVAAVAAVGVGGAIVEGLTPEPPGSPVFARDFAREYGAQTPRTAAATGSPAGPSPVPTARALDGSLMEVEIVPPSAVDGGVGAVDSVPGEPVFAASSAPGPAGENGAGESVLVDAIVGEINGKPVRASEFLAPLRSSLAALLKEPGLTREKWRYLATGKVYERLSIQVKDELLASAGMADLSAAEQSQLAAYMVEEKRRVVATARGSEEAADQQLRREGKGGLAQYLDDRKRELVIRRIIEQHIMPRIQVTMRDIEVYYRQHPERYNSPNQYVFRLIAANPRDPLAPETIAKRLAAGEAFADVASSSLNSFHADQGGTFSSPHESAKAQGESTFFNDPALNDAARTLKVGAWAGPIEYDGSANWLALDEIVDRTRALFDVQIEAENAVRIERSNKEFEKYLNQLRDQGSYTAIDEMVARLVTIAEHQILGRVTPGVGVDAGTMFPASSLGEWPGGTASEVTGDDQNAAAPDPRQ